MIRDRGMLRRVPIRFRLALAFAIVMAVVLAGTGAFVHARLAAEEDATIAREVTEQLARIAAVVRDDGDDLGSPGDDPLERLDETGLVQILDAGTVAGTTVPALRERPLLSPAELDRLLNGESTEVHVAALGERFRLAAAIAPDDGVDYTLIVGRSVEQRYATLTDLRNVLLIGGPIALVLASLAAYGVASGALRPVENMRKRATEISAGQAGQRLPVPPARDEIAHLGATLNEMLARMERAFQRERSFAAVASHELRTPLAILKTELELASEPGRSLDELQAAIRSASEETERLVGLAEDLLVLARAAEGRLPLRRESVELVGLAQRVCRRFEHRTGPSRRVVVVSAPAHDIRVTADRARLEQALSNMVDNALRHGDGHVAVDARRRNGRVELHVVDDGPGFPPDVADRAFERFARGGAAGSSGAGLGLAIVAAVASAHGATAHAENRAGGGADVWLSLPQRHP